MSRVCSVCDKGRVSGNKVSHSNRKSRRGFSANLQRIRMTLSGKTITGYVCTRCLKGDKVERA